MTDLRSATVPPLGAGDHVRGDPQARLVLMYADFTCPRCVVAHQRLQQLPVRLAFRHFALKARHPRAVALACAAEAAGRQGRFWEMHDSLFADPARTEDPHLWERAQQIGLDLDRFEADRRDPSVLERVAGDLRGGLRAGVSATPTLFVDGQAHCGPPDAALIERLGTA